MLFSIRIKSYLLCVFGELSDVRGNATGRANIAGALTKPEIDGRLYLNNAGMRVPYLNVDYAFEKNAIVDITEHQFSLRKIEVTDTKYKTKGILVLAFVS